jgi:cob(I)alamin adenosyltransferase
LSACPPSLQERFASALERCIDNLFVCALPLKQESLSAETAWLEEEIDKMEAQLPALDSFIKPLGGEFSMRLHLARTDVRTLERALCETVFQTPDACAFINRLSDYLFVASRYVNHISGTPDVPEVFE